MTTLGEKIQLRIRKWLKTPISMPGKWLYTSGIRSVQDLDLPDFLCIGAQKGGTSWLFNNLSAHPEVFVPNVTPHYDIHYFDLHLDKSLQWYSNYFEPGRNKIKGESTPAYGVLSPKRIKLIKSLMPQVKIIFMIRNPIDRAWSHALMTLCTHKNRNPEAVGDVEFYGHFSSNWSRERSDYFTIYKNWSDIFPSEQIYVGFFEDISNRPQILLSEIFTHIGVSQDVDWTQFPFKIRINKGIGTPMPEEYKHFLRELYCTEISRLHQIFGNSVSGWLC